MVFFTLYDFIFLYGVIVLTIALFIALSGVH